MTANINLNWSRWVHASFVKHFHTSLSGVAYAHAEGQRRQTEGKQQWFEIRVDGPFTDEQAHKQFLLEVEVNILCCYLGEDNIYGLDLLTGAAANTFTYCVPCLKLGGEAGDDSSVVGYFTLIPRKKEKVEIVKFGKIRHDSDLYQATVEGHYKMELEI